MIKDFEYNSNGKLESFTYSNEDINLQIEVVSFEAVYKLKAEEQTIGKIIEIYREKTHKNNLPEAKNYFKSKENIINAFLEKLIIDSKCYDYVQVMLPTDEHRKDILKRFSEKFFNNSNDLSSAFVKTRDSSIVGLSCEEAAQYFTFNKPKITTIPKTILIVDDTISTGCTINIFLDNLKKADLLATDTKITAKIIYNNFKDNIPKVSFIDLKNQLGTRCS